jgi:hypothetical protein
MPSKRLFIGVIILLTLLLAFIFMIRRSQEETPCSYSISLKNGDKIEAKRINFYPSGFCDVHTCDGDRQVISESSIVEIKNTKNDKFIWTGENY